MIKSMTSIFHEVEGKIFHLICEANSPAEHVKEAALAIANICDGIIDAAQKAQEAQVKQASPEEPKVEAQEPQV
jgi:hypothetical protein